MLGLVPSQFQFRPPPAFPRASGPEAAEEAHRLAPLRAMEAALEKGKFGRTKAYQLINDGKIVAYKMDQRPWSTPTASTLVTRR
jgi:hypothetical protein